ncbi:MAG TPA: alpha/beta fold hydrolase [Beijerinckiaceae bacterium]|jgi:pimeloyl-ACP methyl ester carboxylesterase
MSPSIARRAFALVFSLVLANAGAARAAEILTVDRLVAHTSTVPAVRGEKVGLFVRERVASGMLDGAGSFEGKVVLMVHGGFSPATLAFDVAYRDYSWMEHLAREGFDVFAMDMTGYGRSTRPPQMDDPCNLVPAQQKEIAPRPLATPCKASYPHELVNSDSETDDINAVVDFIRKLRGVDKIALVGWSGGGIRTGTFVTRHPEKVDRYVIWASSNYSRANPSQAPELPAAGAPTTFQTRRVGVDQRWLGTSKCDGFIEPGLPEMISALNQQADPLGASWGPGGLRAPTRTYWGWNAEGAKKVVAPTLIMVGEQDGLMKSNQELYEDLGAQQKVYLSIACGTHFMNWEAQRRVLHKASADWLKTGTLGGAKTGAFRADEKGAITERRP